MGIYNPYNTALFCSQRYECKIALNYAVTLTNGVRVGLYSLLFVVQMSLV